MSDTKILWRLLNVYPSGKLERKKLDSILRDCMKFLESNGLNQYTLEQLFPECVIPCEIPLHDEHTKPLPGHIFLAINGTQQEYIKKVFEFFYRRKDIMHISNAPAIDKNIISNLKKMKDTLQNDPLSKFQVGSNILITKGEFSGMSGKVVKKYKDAIDVSMFVFGRELIRNIEVGCFELSSN